MAVMSVPEVARGGAARESMRQRFGLVPISAAGDATQRRNCTPITPEPVILRASGCGTPGRSGLVPAMMPHRAAAGALFPVSPFPRTGRVPDARAPRRERTGPPVRLRSVIGIELAAQAIERPQCACKASLRLDPLPVAGASRRSLRIGRTLLRL